jgi:putative two-component system response regulator
MASSLEHELSTSRMETVQPGTGFGVLVVEDDEDQLLLTAAQLQKLGFEVSACIDGESAKDILEREKFHAIVCDFGLPGDSGGDILVHVRRHHSDLAFVMLTGHDDVARAVESMRNGADEYLLKPVPPRELATKILDAIEKHEQASRAAKKSEFERMVQGMSGMVLSLEVKDRYTLHHSRKVERLAIAIAEQLPDLSDQAKMYIRIGARLHDVGKIATPLTILHKEGPLNDEEWKVIKEHPLHGERITKYLPREVRKIVRFEHERWDGKGYTEGLAEEQIPLGSRLVMIADTYDAICSDRPYRDAMSMDEAVRIIRDGSGTQFDPNLVPVFEKVVNALDHPHE